MRFAVVGAGFWADYQVAAWRELPEVDLVAVCDPDLERAARFGVPAFQSPEQMLNEVRPDFVDVISSPESHPANVRDALSRGIPCICQKPMADDFDECRELVKLAQDSRVPFFIHENWRWQRPLRRVREILESGEIGKAFRGRLQFSCSFPVFENQPFLAEVDRFILLDIGSHVLDSARSFFGEATRLTCLTKRVNPKIKGEDVATVLLDFGGVAVTCEMSYASRMERERFPQTYIVIEGSEGSLELGPDYEIRVTTQSGTRQERADPPRYPWADPDYDVVHASIVDCHRDILLGLRGDTSESAAASNLETLRLVFASYESAATRQQVDLTTWNR